MKRIRTLVFIWVIMMLSVHVTPLLHAGQFRESHMDLAGIAKSDPEMYQRVTDAGAKTLVMEGQKPFLVYWLPENFRDLPSHRLFVVLHGTNGNAYHHLANFLDSAKKHHFGILSVQWGWPSGKYGLKKKGMYKYIKDARQTYRLIVSGIKYLDRLYSIQKTECAWLGFSRSSTQCAVFAHLDKNEGQKWFALFIAASGGIGENLPIMRDLASGKFGDKPLRGQHFYLWGGKKDRSQGENMRESKPIIEQLGGSVDILQIGKEGHGGFNHNPQYQEEAWRLWASLCSEKTHK